MTQNAIGSALRRALHEDNLQCDADATVRTGPDEHGAMGVRALLAAENLGHRSNGVVSLMRTFNRTDTHHSARESH
jgi:hypothetical protein